MTCFWNGIIKSLNLEDLNMIGNFEKKPNANELCNF